MKNKTLNIIIIVLVLFVSILLFLLLMRKEETKEETKKDTLVFELSGDKDIYVLINGKYEDKKAFVYDNGVDYSKEIIVTDTCDTTNIGDCTISYKIERYNKELIRNVHVSDFSDWIKLEYDAENKQEIVKINVNIDEEKIDKYILPNGETKYYSDSFTIEKNGKYTIKIYDKYGNELDKEFEINNVIIKPIVATCSATAEQNTTIINVSANKKIISYVYNGEKSTENTFTIDKRIKENKVVLHDDDNQELEIKCTTTVKPYDSFGLYKHVFIIGVDGLGDAFSKTESPNFDRIFGEYAYRHDANTEYETISAQNWSSILNGVSYDKHGLTNDILDSKERDSNSEYLTIFSYVRKIKPNDGLVSIVNWEPINHGLIEKDINVIKKHGGSDEEVTNEVINYLKNNDAPTLLFSHFDEVDHAGHSSGGYSGPYINAVHDADSRIGRIFDTINSLGLMKDSLFIVVADHGEAVGGGHGGHTKEESSAIVAVRGYTVNKTILNADTHNRDVSAIALYALGIEKPNHFISVVPKGLFGEPRK